MYLSFSVLPSSSISSPPPLFLFSHHDFSTSLNLCLKCPHSFSRPPPLHAQTWGPWLRQRSHADSDVDGVQQVYCCLALTYSWVYQTFAGKRLHLQNWAICLSIIRLPFVMIVYVHSAVHMCVPGTCRRRWIPGIWHHRTAHLATSPEQLPQLQEDPSSHNLCSKKYKRIMVGLRKCLSMCQNVLSKRKKNLKWVVWCWKELFFSFMKLMSWLNSTFQPAVEYGEALWWTYLRHHLTFGIYFCCESFKLTLR